MLFCVLQAKIINAMGFPLCCTSKNHWFRDSSFVFHKQKSLIVEDFPLRFRSKYLIPGNHPLRLQIEIITSKYFHCILQTRINNHCDFHLCFTSRKHWIWMIPVVFQKQKSLDSVISFVCYIQNAWIWRIFLCLLQT